MDPTTGLGILGVCGVVIAAIVKFVPSKTPPLAPTNGNRPVSDSTCQTRTKAIEAKIDSHRDIAKVEITSLGREIGQLRTETNAGFDRMVEAIKTEKNEGK